MSHDRLVELFKQAHALTQVEQQQLVRSLSADDVALSQALAELLGQSTVVLNDRIKGKYGEVDPHITLDGTAESDTDFTADVRQRLAGRGEAFGRYRIRGEVARGGQGVVLRVWDEDLRRNLAMKMVLRKNDSQGPAEGGDREFDAASVGRFLEEAQVTGQLDHPGIVPVHELGLDPEGQVFFTMKLVKGEDLRSVFEKVEDGKSDWSLLRALGVMLKVCEAMSYAHAKGVIHRDLKPGNVMVGRFGEVYVMDWGLARVLDRDDAKDIRIQPSLMTSEVHSDRRDRATSVDSPLITMDGDVVGTPAYMSPEQATGDLNAMGPHSDVYAVGAMLYHLCAGHMPYVPPGARLNNYAVWSLAQQRAPESLNDLAGRNLMKVPAELVAITEKAMARDVSARYPDMLRLADDLRAFLEGRVVRAYETGAWAESRKWMRRNRTLAAVLMALVLALALGVAVSSYLLGQTRRTLREVERLSDVRTLTHLRVAADTSLWPLVPTQAPAMRAWLREARDLQSRLPEHQRDLEALLDNPDDPTVDALELAQQTDFVVGLAAFQGIIEQVERRYEFVSTITARSVEDRISAWNETSAQIANSRDNPKYAGLRLEPQVGLVPLGPDPESGLFEFAHLATGEVPRRDTSNRLILTESSGIVLVLIPATIFWMGSQSTSAELPNYDAGTNRAMQPVHQVSLSPYFISKYEMTQGQWLRLTGDNPSAYRPGIAASLSDETGSLCHPVEQVSWHDCDMWTRRAGLSLPSEAQWECAARAGTQTRFSSGDKDLSLLGAANLRDVHFANDKNAEVWGSWQKDFDDGTTLHWEVGSRRPNPFGLHDVHGNVWEWCLDSYGPYPEWAPGDPPVHDPVRAGSTDLRFVYRGGCFRTKAGTARSAARSFDPPSFSGSARGLRPARGVVSSE